MPGRLNSPDPTHQVQLARKGYPPLLLQGTNREGHDFSRAESSTTAPALAAEGLQAISPASAAPTPPRDPAQLVATHRDDAALTLPRPAHPSASAPATPHAGRL